MSQKMFKSLIKSLKKNKNFESDEQSSTNNVKFEKLEGDDISLRSQLEGEGSGTSGRRTPLLTWSASLDNLVQSCKNEKKTQNCCREYSNRSKDVDESTNEIDFANLADDYKEELRFDSPQFCSTEKKLIDTRRQLHYCEELLDNSYLTFGSVNLQTFDEQERNLYCPIPIARRQKSMSISSNNNLFSPAFIGARGSTNKGRSSRLNEPGHCDSSDKYISNLDSGASSFISESVPPSAESASHEFVDGSGDKELKSTARRLALNSSEDSLAASSMGPSSESCENIFERRPAPRYGSCRKIMRDYWHKPSHLFEIFNNKHEWKVIPLRFLHCESSEPFTMTSDAFDQPFVLHPGSYKHLREGDRFLEINEVLVIQMKDREILALMGSLLRGCFIRVVVLRKVIGDQKGCSLAY